MHAVALGTVQTGQNVKNVLYTAARENAASGRKHQGRLKVNLYHFGVRDAEDQTPSIFQLKQRQCQHKGFELLHIWLVKLLLTPTAVLDV